MRNSYRPGWVLFLFSFLSLLADAQEKSLSDLTASCGKKTAWMKANLALSAYQAPMVEDINVKYEQKNLVLQTGGLSRRQKLQIFKTNETAKDEELKKILTAEQFMAWQNKKKEIDTVPK